MFASFSFPSSVGQQSQADGQFSRDECGGQPLIAPRTRVNGKPAQAVMSNTDVEIDRSITSISHGLDQQTLGGQSRKQSTKRPTTMRRPSIQPSNPQDYTDIVRQNRHSYAQLHSRSKRLAKVASVVERLLVEGTSAYDVASDSRRSSSDVSDSMLPSPDENYANRNMMDLSAASGSESEYPMSSYASATSSYSPLEFSFRKTSFQREREGNVVEKKIRMRKRKVVGGHGVRRAG